VDEYERYIIYFLENIMGREREGQFVIISDLHGSTLNHKP